MQEQFHNFFVFFYKVSKYETFLFFWMAAGVCVSRGVTLADGPGEPDGPNGQDGGVM
jgi:hypothetical protein